ncbi:hypothetical protein DEO72_LG2g3657 [Vigna unguiculata]|uniref:Uncharacterized protein n=1 Tax=Vigna unguiculata TaxID=3917 RepID=A0A4D6L472_VIGUN|nr:hypothetical protein DEO72_LG2g3657 [Vigna unguiculata]
MLQLMPFVRSSAAPLGKELMEECAKHFPRAIVAYVEDNVCGMRFLIWIVLVTSRQDITNFK